MSGRSIAPQAGVATPPIAAERHPKAKANAVLQAPEIRARKQDR